MKSSRHREHALTRRITAAEEEIRAAGFELRYVEWCEDSDTPGILGLYGGVTDRRQRLVKIATRRTSRAMIATRLEHELHHVQDPEWDCGNRPLFRSFVVSHHPDICKEA